MNLHFIFRHKNPTLGLEEKKAGNDIFPNKFMILFLIKVFHDIHKMFLLSSNYARLFSYFRKLKYFHEGIMHPN